MRRGVTIFIVATFLVLGFAVHSVWTLLGLLVATGREDAILRGELPAPNSGTINDRPQLIPKIIHQTYKNNSIPTVWKEAQQSCLDLHPDYEYKMWTDKKSREFIADEYVTAPLSAIRRHVLTAIDIPGSLRPSTATLTPYNAPTRFATSYSTTLAAFTST